MKKKTGNSQFLSLLLSLTESGLPLSVALKVLCQKKDTEKAASKIMEALEKGESVSEAVCKSSARFKNYQTMLSCAEESGDIENALKGMTEEISEKEREVRNLIAVSLYPLAMCILAFVLSIVLIVYGIPYISLIAEVDEGEFMEAVVRANVFLIFSAVILFVFIRKFSSRYDFCYVLFLNLYYLNKSGVGMEDALRVLMREKYFSEKELGCISNIMRGLRGGEKLYKLCEKDRRFDAFCISWLFVAEESGEDEKAFKKIYENYRIKKKERSEAVMRITEPALLGISGIYILILIAGCVIPVFMNLGSKII